MGSLTATVRAHYARLGAAYVALGGILVILGCSSEPLAGAGPQECSSPARAPNPLDQNWDFSLGAQCWAAGFSDYHVGADSLLKLTAGVRTLPAPLDTTRQAYFISGRNRSDDLFMYLKRRITGLHPAARYQLRFGVLLATDEPSGCVGAGGSPGESVWLKAGADSIEPVAVVDSKGWLQLNLPKGNQSVAGGDAVLLGTIDYGPGDCINRVYTLKTFDSSATPLETTADGQGNLWLFVGTDSGFEGLTALYYLAISVRLSPV